MTHVIQLGDIVIEVTRKEVKNVHLSVHPPDGRVTLVAPMATRLAAARAYAASRTGWIRRQQAQFRTQVRESPRGYVERESHYIWGRRYLLRVREVAAKPTVRLSNRTLTLTVRPGSARSQRAAVMEEWQRSLLHDVLPALIRKWEKRLNVQVSHYYLQRMKTRWGGCSHRRGTIRLNTELVKKPLDLLEYVLVHEMIHLVEPTHSERYMSLLNRHYPGWREARMELNELPLSS